MKHRIVSLGTLLATLACSGGIDPRNASDDELAGLCPEPASGVIVGGLLGGGTDIRATASRRVILMGGGAEEDMAAKLFVESAGGGDVLVLRASGSLTSYPTYFAGTLEPQPGPASVITVLTSTPAAGGDPAVTCRLDRAEAVWLAGGDQWDYLGLWPDGLHARLSALDQRGVAVGGTSAGAMSLGEAAFAAEFGGVTSAEALADPLAPGISIRYPSFAQPELAGALVDTHFSNRAREGRLLTFLARFIADRGHPAVLGIGIDERTALIVEDGTYRVYGEGAVWFYRVSGPVALTPGAPLDLDGVEVARRSDGDGGAWPVDLDLLDTESLRVEAGVVTR
jgi:cyanophycinase